MNLKQIGKEANRMYVAMWESGNILSSGGGLNYIDQVAKQHGLSVNERDQLAEEAIADIRRYRTLGHTLNSIRVAYHKGKDTDYEARGDLYTERQNLEIKWGIE